MNQKLHYQDMELNLFQPSNPTIFGKEGHLMVVSDSLENGNGYLTAKVLAYIPGREYPVVTKDGQYKFCAEVPVGKISVNEYIHDNPFLMKGKVTTICARPNHGKTEALCRSAIAATNDGISVLYITMEFAEDSILNRINNMSDKPCRNLSIVTGRPRMKTSDVQRTLDEISCIVKPEVVIIDYVSLLYPVAHTKSQQDSRRAVYFELLDIAAKNDIAIITGESFSAV